MSDWKARAQSLNAAPTATTPDWKSRSQAIPSAEPSALGNFASDALDYSARALDYGGGMARTAAASAAGGVQAALGGNQPVTQDDLLATLKGRAPNTNEYMEKFGVPKGNVNVPLIGDVSPRAVAGFAGDVLLDPITYLTGGVSAAAKASEMGAAKQLAGAATKPGLAEALSNRARKLLSPAGDAIERAGDSIYESAYKVPDAKLAKVGVDPIGPIMLENGRPQGSAATLQSAIDDLMTEKVAKRKDLYEAVEKAGGRANMLSAMQPAGERAKELIRIDPNAGPQLEQMGDWLKNYTREGEQVPVGLASDWKTRLYNASLPQNAYNPLTGKALPIAADIKKSFASGLKNEIERAGNAAIPEAGNKISALNQELGPLIESSRKIMPTEVLKDATKNAFTSVDGLVLGDVLEHPGRAGMFALKKLADVYNTPLGRTTVGNGLSAVGRSGAVDPMLRRGLINYNNPWEMQK